MDVAVTSPSICPLALLPKLFCFVPLLCRIRHVHVPQLMIQVKRTSLFWRHDCIKILQESAMWRKAGASCNKALRNLLEILAIPQWTQPQQKTFSFFLCSDNKVIFNVSQHDRYALGKKIVSHVYFGRKYSHQINSRELQLEFWPFYIGFWESQKCACAKEAGVCLVRSCPLTVS